MGSSWQHDGTWSQHLGRASYSVQTSAELVLRVAADGNALNGIVLPHLDGSASALSSRAPRWVLNEVRPGFQAGFVALTTVDDTMRSPKVLLRSELVPDAVPTRVALDLDLVDNGSRTVITARWDVGVELPLPGLAARAVQPLLGLAVERLVRDLVDGLALVAEDHLDAELEALTRTPEAQPRPPLSFAPVVATVVPPTLPVLERDPELEALLDEVIRAR